MWYKMQCRKEENPYTDIKTTRIRACLAVSLRPIGPTFLYPVPHKHLPCFLRHQSTCRPDYDCGGELCAELIPSPKSFLDPPTRVVLVVRVRMESPGWAVRPGGRGSISPAPGWPTANDGDGERGKNEDRMSPFSSQADKFWLDGREGPAGGDRDDEDSLGGDYRVSDEKFLPRSGSRGRDAGASAREAWGEGTRDSNSADAQSRRAEAEWKRFRRSGLTTAEEREAELLATAGDLKILNEELQVELQRERQRTADLVHKADRMARELDTERMERKKYERESTHKARELSWAHSLIQELRSQIDDTTHRDESQAKVQTELLTLLEQQVHDGDKVVKELQESLVKSELEIDVLRRDATAASEARAAAEESNQKLRMAAAEDQRKTRILIKYKENAQKQMTQQHEAVLKKLFDSAALLDRESSDDVEAGGILGTAWPRGSSPLKRELEAEARSEARALGGRRSSGDTSWRKEAGGMEPGPAICLL